MNKISIPHGSHAYTDFVTDEEKKVLRNWILVLQLKGELITNRAISKAGDKPTLNRFWNKVSNLKSEVPPEFHVVKQRIMELENLTESNWDTHLDDFVSVNKHGAMIQEHIDPNFEGCVHTRYNLILSKPEQGGYPIYGGKIVEYEEKMLWRCQAGLYRHSSTKTEGGKPRVNLSFGFQIPIE